LVSHQQAATEHWDLPNTAIFQSKDVASGLGFSLNSLALAFGEKDFSGTD
jgi:hypothetical protein